MHHDPGAARLARLKAELLRDERALVAEGQRFILHRGRELAAMSGRIAGSAGEKTAKWFGEAVLWSQRSPDQWPIGAIIALLRDAAELTPAERVVHVELLQPLLRLARSADDLCGLRAEVAELEAGGLRRSS